MPDQEQINDRAKLIMHRLLARELARDANLVVRAREFLRQRAMRMPEREFTREWEQILSLPLAELRRALTGRSEEMARLRLSSPFPVVSRLGLNEIPLRRRIWRMARRSLERSPNVATPGPQLGDR